MHNFGRRMALMRFLNIFHLKAVNTFSSLYSGTQKPPWATHFPYNTNEAPKQIDFLLCSDSLQATWTVADEWRQLKGKRRTDHIPLETKILLPQTVAKKRRKWCTIGWLPHSESEFHERCRELGLRQADSLDTFGERIHHAACECAKRSANKFSYEKDQNYAMKFDRCREKHALVCRRSCGSIEKKRKTSNGCKICVTSQLVSLDGNSNTGEKEEKFFHC